MDNQITFTFTDFTAPEVDAILAGLHELPGKVCNPIVQKIQQQAQPQIAAWQAANANAEAQ